MREVLKVEVLWRFQSAKDRMHRRVKELRWKWQRAHRGMSDLDWWNLEQSVAKLVADGCSLLREKGHGYAPGTTPEQWHEILRKIEKGFRAYIELATKWQPKEREIELKRDFDIGMELFVKHYESLWD